MPRKGSVATRRIKHGPNKGQTAKVVTIRSGGKITHSYRVRSSRKPGWTS